MEISFWLKEVFSPNYFAFLLRNSTSASIIWGKKTLLKEGIQKPFDYSFLFEYIINFTVRYFQVLELLVVLMCLNETVLFFSEKVVKHTDSLI